jgi:tellurite methyltransferase
MMATVPFWEECYKRPGKLDTFGGGKPSEDVVAAASLLSDRLTAGASALDLGCGEGRNAIYLANLGFETWAVDISVAGIHKLSAVAKENGLRINALVRDMREYDFPCPFDLIVCQGCLHLVRRDEWQPILTRIKNGTAVGGLSVIGVLTDTVPEPEDQRGLMVGLFKEGELLEHYADWDVLDSRTFQFEHEHPGGIRHEHAGNNLTARKPLHI